MEVVRSLLLEAHMPLSYWGEALTVATYVINWIPSSSNDFQTPMQTLTNKVVTLGNADLPPRVFGCVAFVHIQKNLNKLTPRALRCVFLGYAMHQKGYRCYHPPTKRMFVSMDLVFHERIMYFSALQEVNHQELQIFGGYDCQEYVYLEKGESVKDNTIATFDYSSNDNDSSPVSHHLEVNCNSGISHSYVDDLQSSYNDEMENEIPET